MKATIVITPAPGRLFAWNCFQCHGTDGRGEIMTIHALGYTDAQLRAIAECFSRQPR